MDRGADRRRVADFLDELRAPTWTTYPDFRAAGRRPLLAAIERHGGISTWAQSVGLSVSKRGSRRRWSQKRIDAELRTYLARRPTAVWPTRAEFIGQGQRQLLAALDTDQGLAHWKGRASPTRCSSGGCE